MAHPAEALAALLAVLDRMKIPYAIGGSLASSAHGIPRMTNDADLVVDLQPDQVEEFVDNLEGFYADPQTIHDALKDGRPFNLIHMDSVYKFDLFPLKADAYSRISFGRRTSMNLTALGPSIECDVSSPEDTILRKLEWYRLGGEASERQWSDLRGIVRISGHRLDDEYLRKWASELRLTDLLEELLKER